MKRLASAFVAAAIVALSAPAMAQKTAGNVVDDNTVNASVKAALIEAKDVPSTAEQIRAQHILVAIRTPVPAATPLPEGQPMRS